MDVISTHYMVAGRIDAFFCCHKSKNFLGKFSVAEKSCLQICLFFPFLFFLKVTVCHRNCGNSASIFLSLCVTGQFETKDLS